MASQLYASQYLYELKRIQVEKPGINDFVNNTMLHQIIKTQELMMDKVGISMHHDAITGTSLQATVADYVDQFEGAMRENTKVYERVFADRIQRLY